MSMFDRFPQLQFFKLTYSPVLSFSSVSIIVPAFIITVHKSSDSAEVQRAKLLLGFSYRRLPFRLFLLFVF